MPQYQKNKEIVEGRTPGVWNASPEGGVFCCPICAHANSLESYAIGDAGAVTPTFKCAAPGCAFTGDIVLSGWGA